MGAKKHIDFVSAIFFMVLSLFMITEGLRYHNEITQRLDLAFYESPGFFPVVLGVAILICSALLLIRSLKGGALKENIENIAAGARGLINKEMGYAALGIAFMVVYVFVLLPWIGFVFSSIIFLVGIMLYLKAASLPKILAIAISITVVAFLVVEMIFRAPLP